MFSISREFSFCYGHRLLEYQGKCRHPHGHNGRLVITVSEPELNSIGMVRDFSELKKEIGGWIDSNLDHRMILASNDPLTRILLDMGEPVFTVNGSPTAERLAQIIFHAAKDMGFSVLKVEFWETPSSCAVYTQG